MHLHAGDCPNLNPLFLQIAAAVTEEQVNLEIGRASSCVSLPTYAVTISSDRLALTEAPTARNGRL
jgi:hypothetical protein